MRKILVSFIVTLCSVAITYAQIQSSCPAIVEETLEALGNVCANLDRNTACYGASQVERELIGVPAPENVFVNPDDRVNLIQLRDIHPQPLNQQTSSFGVGILNVQADVPNTLPGQAVIFMLLGGARLTNEVVTPTLQQSPFQSFFFLPGIGQSDCYESEPMLTIQSPQDTPVTIFLNGIETVMDPDTLLTITGTVCTIHRGKITQYVGDEVAELAENQTVDIEIDEAGIITVLGARAISEQEFERGVQVQAAINELAASNEWSLSTVSAPNDFEAEAERELQVTQAIIILAPSHEAAITNNQFARPGNTFIIPDSSVNTNSTTCNTIYTVVRGNTLFRIALHFNVTVQQLVDFNAIKNRNLIFPGQKLCIPWT